MGVFVGLLRGINVSGRNRIAMQALRELFAGLGHSSVETYLQSGNVVFTSMRRSTATLESDIESAITSELGLSVVVLVRTAAQLAELSQDNPFAEPGVEPSQLHVTFLKAVPFPHDAAAKDTLARLTPPVGSPDRFRLREHEVYLHCPGGYGRTKLNNTFWERKLKVAATTRNWNTVARLTALTGA